MTYTDVKRVNNFTNLPLPLSPNGQNFYAVEYSYITTKAEVLTLDYQSDINYYPSGSVEWDKWDIWNSNIENAVERIFKHSSAPQSAYSTFFGDVAKMTFSQQSTNGDIALGMNVSGSPIFAQGGAVVGDTAWLDEEAKSKKWQHYIEQNSQLCLL